MVWFPAWADSKGLHEFGRLVTKANLNCHVESSESPLTLFAPTDEAIHAITNISHDVHLLRELLSVHMAMGSLRYAATYHT